MSLGNTAAIVAAPNLESKMKEKSMKSILIFICGLAVGIFSATDVKTLEEENNPSPKWNRWDRWKTKGLKAWKEMTEN